MTTESDRELLSAITSLREWSIDMTSRRARARANARPWETPERTGWPPGMLQDDCRGLSIWLASKPDARMRAREAAAAIQEPDDDQATGDSSFGTGEGPAGEDETDDQDED